MADDGNTLGDDRLNHREDFPAALDFYKVRTGLAQQVGVFHREFRRGATASGKISGDEGFFGPPGHGARVVEHVGHGHLRRVGLAEDNHAQRVADKQKVQPAAIEHPCCRVIVGCQPSEASAGGFGGAERCGCGFHGKVGEYSRTGERRHGGFFAENKCCHGKPVDTRRGGLLVSGVCGASRLKPWDLPSGRITHAIDSRNTCVGSESALAGG